MIESIRLKRKEELPVSIGDVVQYHGGTFVIINILGIDVKSFRENDNNIFYYCLGQLYGSPDLSANYLTTENELNFSPDQYYNIPQVGELVSGSGSLKSARSTLTMKVCKFSSSFHLLKSGQAKKWKKHLPHQEHDI